MEDYKVDPRKIHVDQRKKDTRRDAWDRDYSEPSMPTKTTQNEIPETSISGNQDEPKKEHSLLKRLSDHCNSGLAVKAFPFSNNEKKAIQSLNLLTLKPMIYIANLDEISLNKGPNNKLPVTLVMLSKIFTLKSMGFSLSPNK